MKESTRLALVTIVAGIIGMAVLLSIISTELTYYRKADELQDWFEGEGYTVAQGKPLITAKIDDQTYSFFIWWIFIENETDYILLRDGHSFYYRWRTNETESWHKFNVREYMAGFRWIDWQNVPFSLLIGGVVAICLTTVYAGYFLYIRATRPMAEEVES